MGFRELRKKENISQTELSKLTGISQTMISAFERGQRDITITKAYKLAKALYCSIYVFININVEEVS